ncbi:MAG: septal ring lytic transglycosylase RlpA family protein [Actinobacteria bacterium]|nr:septal ring lytic transglycosylase RlpA family protein [Actinomycetota bacterium]
MLGAPATARAGSSTGGATAPDAVPAPAPSLLGGTTPSAAAAQGPPGPDTLQPPPGGAMVGTVGVVHGRLTPAQAGRPVVVAVLEAGRWTALGAARADTGGGFAVAWRPKRVGRFVLRASSAGTTVHPTAPVEVYRSVVATWFGPGSYGARTACGQLMTPGLVGVAHRSLPCGTMVDIVYGNQSISVPVVDRGPFTPGVTYDLTAATAQALGIVETVHIGAVALRGGTPVG